MELVVGRIGRAHGVKGEVSVDVRTDVPDVRFAVGRVFHLDNDVYPALTIAATRWHSGRLLVTFHEINDRDATATLRGMFLHVDVTDDEMPEDPDEFYDHQLIGLAARTPTGDDLGVVVDVLHLGVQELLVVTTPENSEVLVPFVSAIVTLVDVANACVVIHDPGGLFDDAAAIVARDTSATRK